MLGSRLLTRRVQLWCAFRIWTPLAARLISAFSSGGSANSFQGPPFSSGSGRPTTCFSLTRRRAGGSGRIITSALCAKRWMTAGPLLGMLGSQHLPMLDDDRLRLLLGGLDRNRPHTRTRCRLTDRLGIVSVILAPLDEGLHALRRISCTRWPSRLNTRPQWCKPPQVSRATSVGTCPARKASTWDRLSSHRRTGCSCWSTPCSVKTCMLAHPMPPGRPPQQRWSSWRGLSQSGTGAAVGGSIGNRCLSNGGCLGGTAALAATKISRIGHREFGTHQENLC